MYKKLSQVIKIKQDKLKEIKPIKTTIWQQQAVYFANKLHIDFKTMDRNTKGLYFKVFKSAFNGVNDSIMSRVYSYLYDNSMFYTYTTKHKVILLVKMYYMYLNRLRGNKKS